MGQAAASEEVQRLGPVSGPIRVVVFGGGPYLERGARQLLYRLEEEEAVELAGVFCQSPGESLAAVVADAWRRRRWLAPPVLALLAAGVARRWLMSPRAELAWRRRLEPLRPRIRFVPDLHAPEVIDAVRVCAPDLGVAYGAPILRPALFRIPRHGTLGIHHGRLPEYRGKKTTFWEMTRGEPTAGVTIQKIGRGLDTGRVVARGEVPIGRRSYRRVWTEIEELGVELLVGAVLDTRSGVAVCRPTAGRPGPLYRDPKLGDLARFAMRRLGWRG